MILNNVRFRKSIEENPRNRLHGSTYTRQQLHVLKAWRSFVETYRYQPTQIELVTLTGTKPSQMTKWMGEWEDSGLIERRKGLRNHNLTEKGLSILDELDELNTLWEEYFDKRTKFHRRINASDS